MELLHQRDNFQKISRRKLIFFIYNIKNLEEKHNVRIKIRFNVNGKKKTFIQDRVPLRKAIEYTEKQAELFEKNSENGEITLPLLKRFKVDYVASLFDDEDVTGDLILDGLDTLEDTLIDDILLYRVLGEKKEDVDSKLPKGKE